MLFKLGDQSIEIKINDFTNDLFYYEKLYKLKSKNKSKSLHENQITEIKTMIKLIK